MDYLKDLAVRQKPGYASAILDGLKHGSEPLRECDRRYELELTFDDFPLDDLLRGWEEEMAAEERGEGVEDAEEGIESTRESDEDRTDSESRSSSASTRESDEDWTDSEP
ncbi:hypothetical protein NLI96_g6695 [Meripilus lineatus]|uniref:Uncharacterized protein n=1 Tax=Meripilus lineatus TaxID=2056292 RepID=A0AAD5V138_9APHY|nr:hypothetical protein NLI96_g6695 [Physisporinus lineatus]